MSYLSHSNITPDRKYDPKVSERLATPQEIAAAKEMLAADAEAVSADEVGGLKEYINNRISSIEEAVAAGEPIVAKNLPADNTDPERINVAGYKECADKVREIWTQVYAEYRELTKLDQVYVTRVLHAIYDGDAEKITPTSVRGILDTRLGLAELRINS